MWRITTFFRLKYTIALWGEIKFQDLLGEVFRYLETLHDLIIIWLLAILLVVVIVRLATFRSPISFLSPDSETLEKMWTILPIIILVTIAFPRIYLLCLQDSFSQNPKSTLKVVRNQWNWQSEIGESSIDHLLDLDRLDGASSSAPVTLIQGLSRILVTSTDVLHSLGLPRLAVKLDSAPGRLNATMLEVTSPGIFIGSCFELCGSGHSIIPINFLVL